jgi:hypothetical protein
MKTSNLGNKPNATRTVFLSQQASGKAAAGRVSPMPKQELPVQIKNPKMKPKIQPKCSPI